MAAPAVSSSSWCWRSILQFKTSLALHRVCKRNLSLLPPFPALLPHCIQCIVYCVCATDRYTDARLFSSTIASLSLSLSLFFLFLSPPPRVVRISLLCCLFFFSFFSYCLRRTVQKKRTGESTGWQVIYETSFIYDRIISLVIKLKCCSKTHSTAQFIDDQRLLERGKVANVPRRQGSKHGAAYRLIRHSHEVKVSAVGSFLQFKRRDDRAARTVSRRHYTIKGLRLAEEGGCSANSADSYKES